MSNFAEEEYDDDDVETETEDTTPRGLRNAAKKSSKLQSELTQTKRELAFAKAGIDPDDPRMKYFVRGYDGDLTAEAVRNAAVEAGFIQIQADEVDPGRQQAASSQQRVMRAASGAVVEDSSEDAAYARLEMAMEEGGVDAMLQVAREYGIPTSIEQ